MPPANGSNSENQLKDSLIEKLLGDPLEFSDYDFSLLVREETGLSFSDLRAMLIRIYDINEKTLIIQSDATKGMIGRLNRISTKKRQRKYYAEVYRNSRSKGKKHVVAEGDSWFQFPMFVTDIIDWLMKDPGLTVYSIAYGADWITNMIYEGKYIEELSIHAPEIFLISGGGNDLIGNNRLAIMINGKKDGACKYSDLSQLDQYDIDSKMKESLFEIQSYISKDFYSFLLLLKAQYWLLFSSLQRSKKLKDLRIITQGYDYVIPSRKINFSLRYPHQPIINLGLQNGQWLLRPMLLKGISDPLTQRDILKYLIFHLNETFIQLARSFRNVIHIDCRELARDPNDWFDEIHLKSHVFKFVAEAYSHAIFARDPGFLIKARDFRD